MAVRHVFQNGNEIRTKTNTTAIPTFTLIGNYDDEHPINKAFHFIREMLYAQGRWNFQRISITHL